MLIELPFDLPGKIYRSPMPFSKFDRTGVWKAIQEAGINLVVVLTEQQEYLVYARKDLPEFYRENGLEVLHHPVPDFGVPSDNGSWKSALAAVSQAADEGKNIVVHCLAGIGRTGIFLASLAKDQLGLTGEEAIQWVRDTLPGAMENNYQEDYVINLDS